MDIDQHFDLIIIGTGSGNSIPSPDFDDKSIAIVEEGTFGGTCLNVGCIPTKMFVYAADAAQQARVSDKLGVHATVDRVDWQGIVKRVFNRVDPIAEGGEEYRRGAETPNITVYDRHATFVGPRTIKTGIGDKEKVISAEQVVIAAGSRPFIPPVIQSSGVSYHTNEDIMRMAEQPEHLIIIGGGYIAMEFAHIFDGLGTKVTVLNRSNRLLRHQDEEISTRFTELATQRFDVHLGADVAAAQQNGDTVSIQLDDGTSVEGDALLVATGRTPNGDLMDLSKGGVELNDNGRVTVDEYGRTTAEGVWALGDVSSPYLLKHVANAEARAVQHNLLHPDDLWELPHDNVPSAVFTNPQIAAVGLSEQQAKDAGYSVTVKVQAFGDVAYGWAMEDQDGFVKLVADRSTGRLLGAHIMGAQASTLIHQLITVMAYDIDVRDFARRQYWIHPALPEVIENAVLGLEFD